MAYADVFDYAVTTAEIHRYLHSVAASPEETAAALVSLSAPPGLLAARDGFYTLAGRGALVDVRRRREIRAARLWPRARWWGRRIAGLPFTRMVAVTGSLAWNNVEPDGDIDFLIVAADGRVWLCRALVAALARVARLTGERLCANYVVSREALTITEQNVYTAYELTHMKPIAGNATYRRMRRENRWTQQYLPNAVAAPPPAVAGIPRLVARTRLNRWLMRLARKGERLLRSTTGTALEQREMKHRIRKRVRQQKEDMDSEWGYSAQSYKDHLSRNRERTLTAFEDRLRALTAGAEF